MMFFVLCERLLHDLNHKYASEQFSKAYWNYLVKRYGRNVDALEAMTIYNLGDTVSDPLWKVADFACDKSNARRDHKPLITFLRNADQDSVSHKAFHALIPAFPAMTVLVAVLLL